MTLWYVKPPYLLETICRISVATSRFFIELCVSRGGREGFQ